MQGIVRAEVFGPVAPWLCSIYLNDLLALVGKVGVPVPSSTSRAHVPGPARLPR
jgi:hypothetical protein